MKRDGRQREPSEQSSGSLAPQSAPRPAPGKVTPTSKLPSQRAVQRKLDAPREGTGPRTRSLAEWTDDPLMDLAHRGITDSSPLPVDGGQQAPAGEPEALAGAGQPLTGTIPLITGPGINKSKGDTAGDRAGETSRDTGTSATTGVPVVLDLDLSFDNSRGTGAGATPKLDPGQGNFNLSFSQPGGRAVSPFGEEFYEPAFAGAVW
jgi:hypothetical protein